MKVVKEPVEVGRVAISWTCTSCDWDAEQMVAELEDIGTPVCAFCDNDMSPDQVFIFRDEEENK